MLIHHENGRDALNSNLTTDSLLPIAIIGIGCRFPGNANNPRTFWDNLRNGVDAITEIPSKRWSTNSFYDPAKNRPGKTRSRWGGLIGGLDQFDPQFFGISPREAAHMDPQQRMLLEVTWEAMEDAGISAERLSGSRTSVYVGISSWDFAYMGLSYQDRGVVSAYNNTGASLSIASNRISYCFDLRGPSASVDTACSSALVSLHLACQSIRNDGCPMALSGGVNALLMPDFFVGFSQLGMLSPDGRCKAFDARANGFVRGEGAGMVLLKPLAQAVADGDRIYAVVRGTAVNQDGRTPGLTVPSQQSQESLLRCACDRAGVAPHMIQYVEAHGTGTLVGDPIETRALGSVLAANRPTNRPCIIGSVKTNIGHLEAGAGIASVIKTALALHHRAIPRNLHFEQPNPAIDFESLKLRVPVQTESWPEGDGLALAGINGFGYGGTNAHVIMQGVDTHSTSGMSAGRESVSGEAVHVPTDAFSERQLAPVRSQQLPQPANDRAQPVMPRSGKPAAQLCPLSARSRDALRATAGNVARFITTHPETNLHDLVGHVAHRRSHLEHRLVAVAESTEQLAQQLALFSQDQPAAQIVSGRCTGSGNRQLAFVCSGQGPQWWAMGRQLLETEPVFRDVIQRCDKFSRQLGPWSLREELQATEAASRMHLTAIAQPAIFAFQVALAALWRHWGISPTQLVGHSVGEVAAAHLAGVYALEEAFRVVYHRGRCMDLASSQGRMLAVGLSHEEARQLIAPTHGEVAIAAVNSPTALTLAGAAAPLQEIAMRLKQRHVFCRELRVEYAFHSALMDPVRDELVSSLSDIRPARAERPLLSTVTGDWLEGPEMDADYWWRNVRETVRFADAMARLAETDVEAIVELSPHPVLAYSVTECYQQSGKPVRVLCSLKRQSPELPTMLRALGELYTLGHGVNWHNVAPKSQRFFALPTYPWQRQTCWAESAESRFTRLADPVHPLLGTPQGGTQPSWQSRLDLRLFPYLDDHCVQDMTVFPAAGYAEMAMAAANEVSGKATCRISRLVLSNPCMLSTEQASWLETRCQADQRSLTIHSRLADKDGNWTLHATADYSSHVDPPAAAAFDWKEFLQNCSARFDQESCYAFIEKLGLDYGPAFRAIVEGGRCDGEAIGIVEIPESLANQQCGYIIHPALLDGCFQVTIPADTDFETDCCHLYLPIEIDQLNLYHNAGSRVVCHARLRHKTAQRMVADLDIYNDEGHLILEIRGLTSQRVNGARSTAAVDELLYKYHWQSAPLESETLELGTLPSEAGEDDLPEQLHSPSSPQNTGQWIVFADGTGVSDALIARLRTGGDRVITVLSGERFAADTEDRFHMVPGDRDQMVHLMNTIAADTRTHCRGIVHLWNLDAPKECDLSTAELEAAQDAGLLSVLHLVQARESVEGDLSNKLFLVTQGAQSVAQLPELTAIAQSPVVGLGRVIISEQTNLRCKLVDLDPRATDDVAGELFAELHACDDEDEIALRAGERFVHRFAPVADETQEVPRQLGNLPYRLDRGRGYTIDDLALRTAVRPPLEPHEVEIEVAAAALNFSDVMKALGLYPGATEATVALGAECAGVITRTGSAVTEFAPGDEVIAVAPHAFASHVVAPAQLVAIKPQHLSFQEATTIPIAFLTATYALDQLARVETGERVLIHSASGGVGLAAVQCARQAGAEVLATAGTASKREFLRQQGIQQVMDSRSLAFADQVRRATGGAGVDVILNALAGEAIPRGIEALATGGRFLEIGKRDIYGNMRLGLLPFRNNLAFFAIDLDQLMRERPERIGKLLNKLTRQFVERQLTPLPHTVFDIGDIQDAFRYMQQGKHIGKVVISMRARPQRLQWGACEDTTFAANATYLITGGLGGFGLALAQWLVDRGARHLALIGRRGVHTDEARQAIGSMEAQGAAIRVVQADVSDHTQLAQALDDIEHAWPPLRGLFHAAMVLEDGLLLNSDRDWMRRVMAPKMNGAWNLHSLTKERQLDHFVLFSSLSSVFGHAGQGNYAAANAMLDALTYHRRAQGMPCLTVNWGYLGDVGYLAQRQALGERLERQGVMSFTVREAFDALERVIQRDAVQVSVMRVDWARWRGLGITSVVSPRFAHLLPNTDSGECAAQDRALPNAEAVRKAAPEARSELVDRLLRDKMARLLGIDPQQLDAETPLLDLGLDSLMAVEMRNWVESQTGVDLPVSELVRSPGLVRLVDLVCSQVAPSGVPLTRDTTEPAVSALGGPDPRSEPEHLLSHLDHMSDGEVDALLTNLLEKERNDQQGPAPIARHEL